MTTQDKLTALTRVMQTLFDSKILEVRSFEETMYGVYIEYRNGSDDGTYLISWWDIAMNV